MQSWTPPDHSFCVLTLKEHFPKDKFNNPVLFLITANFSAPDDKKYILLIKTTKQMTLVVFKNIILFYMFRYFGYMYICTPGVCLVSTAMPKEASDSLKLDGYKLPCGCWELHSGPLEEQPGQLTTEPSLQTHGTFLRVWKT